MTPQSKTFQPNAFISTDSYKLAHMRMYPENTSLVYSNFTPRSDKHSPIPEQYQDGRVVVFGIQAVIQEMVALWDETFFSKPWSEVEQNLSRIVAPFVGDSGFDVGISEFKKLHTYGKLPLSIKALPEGTLAPLKVPIFTVKNLHNFYWLTNYIETYLSQQCWKMVTVATIARAYKKILTHYTNKTGADPSFIDFQAHDFSARGLSGSVDNAMVAAAHLTSFKGTDALLGVQYVEHFYNGKDTFIGASVPASEHSVMTSRGPEEELETFRTLLKEYNSGVVALVSDSYDFWDVMTSYVVKLKQDILDRQFDSMGMSKVVFRPDSGDPVEILCGTAKPLANMTELLNPSSYSFDPSNCSQTEVVSIKESYYEVYLKKLHDNNGFKVRSYKEITPTPQMKGAVACLYDTFPGDSTELGYKQLSNRVGLIYGDSITMQRADTILDRLEKKGFAASNVILGIGSYSYQMLTRDTFGMAMKATYIENQDGTSKQLFKDPKTDDGLKKSAKGLLQVVKENGELVLKDQVTWEQEQTGFLGPLFYDGSFTNLENFKTVRKRIKYNT